MEILALICVLIIFANIFWTFCDNEGMSLGQVISSILFRVPMYLVGFATFFILGMLIGQRNTEEG